MSHFLFWLVACVIIMISSGFPYLGPCDFKFKYIEDCEGFKSKVTFKATQTRYNRSISVFRLEISTPVTIGNERTVELNGSMKMQGGYKPGAFYLKDALCKVLDIMVGDILKDILNAAGVEDCPLPPGDHIAQNYYFDNNKFNVHQVFGEYKMEIFTYDGDTLESCYVAYYELVPKEV